MHQGLQPGMSMSDSKPPTVNIPDAEDDFDDLDDVLDQFSPPPTSTLRPPVTGRPRQNTRVDPDPPSLPCSSGSKLQADGDETEDFARELAMGMESLMKELAGIDEGKEEQGKETGDEERQKLKTAWEAMMIDNQLNAGDPLVGNQSDSGGGYHDRLKQAMEKMKESESKLQGGASGAGTTPPESMESLFRSLDLGKDEEIAQFLETMMQQLLSKDVLYEPLKELAEGFPAYLENPPKPLSDEDKQRYPKQQACVNKIMGVFDRPDYRDDHPEYSKAIVELMSEMQSYGSPPSEIMGSLPPGFDGLDKLSDDKDCTIS